MMVMRVEMIVKVMVVVVVVVMQRRMAMGIRCLSVIFVLPIWHG